MTYARKGVREGELESYASEIRLYRQETSLNLLVGLEITCPRTISELQRVFKIIRRIQLDILLIEYVNSLNDLLILTPLRIAYPSLLVGLAHPRLDVEERYRPYFVKILENMGIFIDLNEEKAFYEYYKSNYEFFAEKTNVSFALGSDSHDGILVGKFPTALRFLFDHSALGKLI